MYIYIYMYTYMYTYKYTYIDVSNIYIYIYCEYLEMDGLEYELNWLRIMLDWDFNSAIAAVLMAFSGITEDKTKRWRAHGYSTQL